MIVKVGPSFLNTVDVISTTRYFVFLVYMYIIYASVCCVVCPTIFYNQFDLSQLYQLNQLTFN